MANLSRGRRGRGVGSLASMLAVLATLASAGLMSYFVLASGGGPLGAATLSGAADADTGFQAALIAAGLVTEADGMQIAEVCRKEHAESMAARMEQLNPDGWTSCDEGTWLKKFQEIADPTLNRTFIDIGCNKGFTSAEFFALFDPELGFRPNKIREWESTIECGACGDCLQDLVPAKPPPPGQAPSVQVVCVEPNLLSFATLIRMREHFFANSRQQWHLVNAAIGNGTSETVRFPRCPPGNELCGMSPNFEQESPNFVVGWDTIPLWSVDALLDMYGLQYVDVLKIDTEGYDVPAIASGMSSLLGRKAGIVAFEYNGGWWFHHRLETLVERMNGLNFVCYFAGKEGPDGSLARLTGCWSAKYEFHGWSNVVCIQRTHELYPHAERLSMRYAKHRSLYYSGDGVQKDADAQQ